MIRSLIALILLAASLAVYLVAENAFGSLGQEAARALFVIVATILGALALMIRFLRVLGKTPSRSTDVKLLLGYIGVALSIAIYYAYQGISDSQDPGLLLPLLGVGWIALLFVSLLYVIFVEISYSPMDKKENLTRQVDERRLRSAGRASLILSLSIALIGVVNYIFEREDITWYIETGKNLSPIDENKSMVLALEGRLEVLSFYRDGASSKPLVQRFFDELGVKTNPNIEYRNVNPDLEPELATEYGANRVNDGTIVVRYYPPGAETPTVDPVAGESTDDVESDVKSEDFRVHPNEFQAQARGDFRDLNEEFFNAMYNVVREPSTIYFTEGHGEMPDRSSDGRVPSLQLFRDLLRNTHSFEDLDADDLRDGVPEDADMVMIAANQDPFTAEELEALRQYLEKGGRLMVATRYLSEQERTRLSDTGLTAQLAGDLGEEAPQADPVVIDPYDELLALVGLAQDYEVVGDVTVIDERLPQIFLASQFSTHASVRDLSQAAAPVFANAMPLRRLDPAPDGVRVNSSIQTTDQAFLFVEDGSTDGQGRSMLRPDFDNRQQFLVGSAVTGPAPQADAEDGEWRAFVISSWLSLLEPQNAEMMRSAVRWLSEESEIDEVPLPDFEEPTYFETERAARGSFWSSIVVGPLLIIIVGLVILGLRSRRSEKGVR